MMLISSSLLVYAELKPLPPGFAEKVKSGWLPPLCVCGESMPEPIIKKWAQRRGGDKVRVLFIAGRKEGMYECLSLARAFDLQCDVIPFWNNWRIAHKDKELWNLLRYYLGSKQYDVIAVSGVWLSYLPDDCEQKIASLIKNKGVGLVYAMHGIFPRVKALQGTPSKILDPLLPLEMDISSYRTSTENAFPTGSHILSKGQDFSQFRWICNVDTSLREGATALLKAESNRRILAAVITRGKGRVIAYNPAYGELSRWCPFFLPLALKQYKSSNNLMDIAKQDGMGKFSRWMNGIESADQFYGWLGKCIIWAAGKEPDFFLKAVKTEQDKVKIKFGIPSGYKLDCRIRAVVRSTFNSRLKTLKINHLLTAGKDILTLHLPSTGMTGKHFLDVYLMDDEGGVLDWNSSSFEVHNEIKVVYEPDYKLYHPADEIKLTFKVSVPDRNKTLTISSELYDLKGRLLINQAQKFELAGKTELDIPVKLDLAGTEIKSRLANARFTFKTSGKSFEVRDQFFVKQSPDWDEYHILAYEGFNGNNPANDVLCRILEESGHDTIKNGYPTPVTSRLGTETGLRNWANWVIYRGSPEKIKQLTNWLKDFSPVKYELQDEPELQHYPVLESRFASIRNKEHFKAWLKNKYSTIENLNSAWGRNYKTWKDIVRPLWYEVLDSDNWTAWFDSRRDLDDFFINKYVLATDAVKKVSPDSLTAINPRSIGTFSGLNMRDLSRKLGSSFLYNDFVQGNSPMGYLHLGWHWFDSVESYIGYSWATAPGINRITREAWDSARRGTDIGWFAPFCPETPPRGDFSYLNGDFTLNAKGKAIAKVNKVLGSGPGDLAVNTKPFEEGIFIYYPRSLFYRNDLAFFEQKLLNNPDQKREKMRGMNVWGANQMPNSFLPHLNALGYQYEFGDDLDLNVERLKRTRVVLLQNVFCMSSEKLELLQEFVKNGGCVIAESGTARRDENGRVYPQTPQAFKDLFGIERTEPNLSALISREKMRIVSKEANNDFSSGGFGQIYRKGKVFYLNFHLPKSNSGINIMQKILTVAGIKPTYQLKNNWLETGTRSNLICSMVLRRKGNLAYLFLTGDGNKNDDDFSIKLPKRMFVYDVLADKNLGELDHIKGKISYGEARLFALSPSRVQLLKILADKKVLSPGELACLNFELTTEDGNPGDCLVLLKHKSETGSCKYLPDIPRKVMLKNGKGTVVFKVPYNAQSGVLEIAAKDLSSGEKAVINLKIRKRRD
jgi:hypothetical protein